MKININANINLCIKLQFIMVVLGHNQLERFGVRIEKKKNYPYQKIYKKIFDDSV